jgi:hypothetical protein
VPRRYAMFRESAELFLRSRDQDGNFQMRAFSAMRELFCCWEQPARLVTGEAFHGHAAVGLVPSRARRTLPHKGVKRRYGIGTERGSGARRASLTLVMFDHENAKRRGQGAPAPIGINARDKVLQGRSTILRNLFERLPERRLQADAGLVITNPDRVPRHGFGSLSPRGIVARPRAACALRSAVSPAHYVIGTDHASPLPPCVIEPPARPCNPARPCPCV